MLRNGLIFLSESRAAKRLVTGTPLRAMSRRFVPGDNVDELVSGDGYYPTIATHDDAIIEATIEYARREGIGPERFEFQMLYGVRRDLQSSLLADGYNVRVYIPFGEAWYPFLMRRLAERPANLLFMAGSVVWESPLGFLWPNKSRRNDA